MEEHGKFMRSEEGRVRVRISALAAALLIRVVVLLRTVPLLVYNGTFFLPPTDVQSN